MRRFTRESMVIIIIAALIVIPGGVMAGAHPYGDDYQDGTDYMIVDALLVRPLGIVATVAGFGLFVISAPFSLSGGNAGQAWKNLVASPAGFTFARPLGDLDSTTGDP